MDLVHAARQRIHSRDAVVDIIGLGYVGLQLVLRFAEERERDDLRVGRELLVAYSPEREDPTNPNHSARTITRICGGVIDASIRLPERSIPSESVAGRA
jgi:UDP-N-acetyl-D-mannosaminuronate dehydrogenase